MATIHKIAVLSVNSILREHTCKIYCVCVLAKKIYCILLNRSVYSLLHVCRFGCCYLVVVISKSCISIFTHIFGGGTSKFLAEIY